MLWCAKFHLLKTAPCINGASVTETFRNCWKISGTRRIQSSTSVVQRFKRDQWIKILKYFLNRRILPKNKHLYQFCNCCRESNHFIYCIRARSLTLLVVIWVVWVLVVLTYQIIFMMFPIIKIVKMQVYFILLYQRKKFSRE